MNDSISRVTAARIQRSGGVPFQLQRDVSRTTVTNVRAAIAHHHGVALANKASGKTDTRIVSEGSHRRVAALIGMVGSSHFISVPEEDLDLREELAALPYETQLMMESVSEARGTPVYPVKPHNLWTLDDTTNYIFAGLSSLKDEVKLTLKDSIRASGTDSLWIPDDNNSMKGMRVALTCAYSGAGTSMDIVVCVSGLSEHQLPGTDFLNLEVPGFCIGGGANVSNKGIGHVLFMRDTEGAKQRKFRWYQEKVFIPGVNSNRLEFDDLDVSTLSQIPPEDTAVVAIDGDIPQLKAMLDQLDLYEEHSIICNKISAAASGAEAAADRCAVFKGMKRELPCHTVRDIPPSRCPMKRRVHKAFKSEDVEGLTLARKDREALIDFISVLPGILGKVCTPENIQTGFIKNGMLDPQARRFPSFNAMFSTCRSNPRIEDYMNIRNQIGKIVSQYDKHGEADDVFFDGCNIRRDVGIRGEEILRNASGLHLRRATIINHRALIEKRALLRQEICTIKLNKMNEENEEHQQKIKANDDAVYRVLKAAQEDGRVGQGDDLSDEAHLEFCSLEDFGRLTVPYLKAFIQAHDDQVKLVKDIPKKGNVKEVREHGVHNAISMAFKCRMKPNLVVGKFPHTEADLEKARGDEGATNGQGFGELHVTTFRIGGCPQVKPSKLLGCPLWRASATRLFELHKRDDGLRVDPGAEVSTDMKLKADALITILQARFKTFVKQRIKQQNKRDHWCLRFAYNNLPLVAAIMILSGHTKIDLECLNERDSLLVTDSSRYVNGADSPSSEGAYLYLDGVRQVFIRSGKVAGRGFSTRDEEHKKAAKESRPSSTFYRLYPSKESTRAKCRRRGHFESLVQVIAAGFDPTSEEVDLLDRDYTDGGIFVVSTVEKGRIKSSMRNLNCDNKAKFRHMLAYQMELGYDLALSPGDVVSMNPGFEAVLGVVSS